MKRVKIVAAATPEAEALLETIRKQVPGCEKIVANGRTHWVINNIAQAKSLLLYAEGDSVGYQMSLGVFPGRRTVMVDGLIWPDGQHGTRTGGVARAVKTLQGFAHELASIPARTHAEVTTASPTNHYKYFNTESLLEVYKLLTSISLPASVVGLSKMCATDEATAKARISQLGKGLKAAHSILDNAPSGTKSSFSLNLLAGLFNGDIKGVNQVLTGKFNAAEAQRVLAGFAKNSAILSRDVKKLDKELKRRGAKFTSVIATTDDVVIAAEPLSDRVSGQIIGDLKRIRSTVRSWKGKMDPAEYRDFVDYETQVGNFIAKTFAPRMSKASKAKLKGMK